MATMTDEKTLRNFAQNCETKIHRLWERMTAVDRVRALYRLAVQSLEDCRVPLPKLEFRGNLEGASGFFHFSDWTLQIAPNRFGEELTPTRDEFLEIASLVYHEARHCEQWFHMARYATMGHDVDEEKLTERLFIPLPISRLAFKEKMGKGDSMLLLTREWYESIYGSPRHPHRVTQKGVALRRTGDFQLVNTFRRGIHKKYMGKLPEEKDAWRIQDLLADHYTFAP